MRKIPYLLSVLFISILCVHQASAQPGGMMEPADRDIRPVVTRVAPSSGPTGTFVEIRGSGFGSVQGDRIVTMTLEGVSHVPVELTAFSWASDLIVARIPGVDEVNYYFDRSPSSTRNVRINVVHPGAAPTASTRNTFTVTQDLGYAPILYRIEPDVIDPAALATDIGRIITVYGSRIPVPQGANQVRFFKVGGDGRYFTGEIVSWSSTALGVRLPSDLERGRYGLHVVMPREDETRSSGTIYFTIGVEITSIERTAETVSAMTPLYAMVDSVRPGIKIPDAPMCRALAAAPPSGTDYSCMIMFWHSPEITDMQPGVGPSGQYLDIRGRCFARDHPGKKVRIGGEGFFEPRELEIISWSDRRVVARLPGPEEMVVSPTGEEAIRSNPDGTPMLMYNLGDVPLAATVEVTRADRYSATGAFTINPFRPEERPVLCCTDKVSIGPGECLKIYGGGFGPRKGMVFYGKDGGDLIEMKNVLWTSSAIRACAHEGIENGPYKVVISRPNGGGGMIGSNTLDVFIGRFAVPAGPAMSLPQRTPTLDNVEAAPQERELIRQPRRADIEAVRPPMQAQPIGTGGDSKKANPGKK